MNKISNSKSYMFYLNLLSVDNKFYLRKPIEMPKEYVYNGIIIINNKI